MENFTEHHKTKWGLLSSIHTILRQHGLYVAEKEKSGYTMTYWINPDNVYRVVKGPDEFDDDEEEVIGEDDFEFNHMPYEVDYVEDNNGNFYDNYSEEISLDAGDILVFITEIEDQVWFVCNTLLMDRTEMSSDWALGFTEYGTLEDLLAEGLIEKVTLP